MTRSLEPGGNPGGLLLPRWPSSSELEAIAFALCDELLATAEERDETRSHIAGAVIFDDYMTDTPGYRGPVALVLFDGGPELIASLTWDKAAGAWIPQQKP